MSSATTPERIRNQFQSLQSKEGSKVVEAGPKKGGWVRPELHLSAEPKFQKGHHWRQLVVSVGNNLLGQRWSLRGSNAYDHT